MIAIHTYMESLFLEQTFSNGIDVEHGRNLMPLT